MSKETLVGMSSALFPTFSMDSALFSPSAEQACRIFRATAGHHSDFKADNNRSLTSPNGLGFPFSKA